MVTLLYCTGRDRKTQQSCTQAWFAELPLFRYIEMSRPLLNLLWSHLSI